MDYDNLVDALADRTSRSDQPHRFLLAMVAELRSYLENQMGIRSTRAFAFGDFSAHPVDARTILSDLAASGLDARHVSSAVQRNDGATTLVVRAVELLHTRSDLVAFVILSGDNWFVPFVRAVQDNGRFALVAALELPSNLSALFSSVGDAYLNARFLLDPRARETLSDDSDSGSARRERDAGSESIQDRAPAETATIEDPGALRALDVLEEYFGQYEEVYLTPLLRKLTESLDEEDGEPKDLVNILQDTGAVWLEKRRGFPYDYTVLLVNRSHPDVVRAMETAQSGENQIRGDEDEDYDEEDYDDDAFDDYEEEADD